MKIECCIDCSLISDDEQKVVAFNDNLEIATAVSIDIEKAVLLDVENCMG